VRYLFLEEPRLFNVPESLTEFRCVILIGRLIDPADRVEISRKLVDAGCLYAMAWGADCLLWDDSIDFANIDKFDPESIPDDQFVMTTWHDDETLEDVLFFAKFNSLISYDGRELNELLVLDLGQENREGQVRGIYERLDAKSPP
jgi:hypothetical protein